ncbi:PhoU domain-containing protein [Desulfurococcus mucosus]|uniref:PhoU family protein n=1 Tax=Desulfurococcus mucosus (strain ATCC 35584 / DSM 2162 / JCM 9187 / O7/1) TaxID=765177 RepID=E8R7P2_DESM0|nr:PhoU domain-containing protein [Desulfurococcus mucosus]ADV64537.1 PhoU family protein [Desulfurococcus mucosus DSM 2162]
MNPELARLRSQASRLYLEAVGLVRDLSRLLEPGDSVRGMMDEEIHEKTEILFISCNELFNSVLVFIARNQPLGPELVEASNLLYLVYDIYRYARYAREIFLADKKGVRLSTPGLREIVAPALGIAVEAMEKAYKAYFEDCTECVEELKRLGEESDRLYMAQLEKTSANTMLRNTDAIALLVLRHIERIVDHAERISTLPKK